MLVSYIRGMEKSLTILLMKARALHHTYIRYSKIDLDTYANEYIYEFCFI